MRLPLARLAVPLALLLAGCPGKKCPPGETDCVGTCLDLQSNPIACGGCYTVCATGATCVAGQCQCPVGQDPCAGACVDTQSDPFHCGSCYVFCGLGTCSAGACACDPLAAVCTGPGAACVDLSSDTGNCGTCRNPCPALAECVSGACQCVAPREPCPLGASFVCVATLTDPANCGGCGNDCPYTNDVCLNGVCGCPAGLPDVCVLTCVNRQTDELNCGTCGNRCATGATCTAGQCVCPTGEVVCGTGASAVCSDRQTDEQNCGTCGNRCATGATCTSGICCPASTPLVCPANPGACCAGTTCCPGGVCETVHSNGLGQSYYDCGSLNQHTLLQAQLAALAWSPNASLVGGFQIPSCTGDQNCLCATTSTQAAVWCAAGSLLDRAGRVLMTPSPNCSAALCPSATTGFPWN
jgi:hypothetical protein